MKQFFYVSLTLLLTAGAFAQEPTEKRFTVIAEGKPQVEVAKPISSQFSFVMKTVKGAPYSAIAEAETIQMLTDGNHIRNKTVTTIYRDSEGRSRRETAGKTPGVPAEVFVSDPVTGANFTLYPEQRMAMKKGAPVEIRMAAEKMLAEQGMKQATLTGDKTVTITANGQTLQLDQLTLEQRAAIEQKMAAAKAGTMVMKEGQPAVGGVMTRKKPGTTESLGQQTIEGVLCDGKRTTTTIPAGSIGNDQPINIVSEEWYSPELQVLVLTKQTDPRHGETIYRLTNINRSEPARTLFEVPADYTIQEPSKAPVIKKRVMEEQR